MESVLRPLAQNYYSKLGLCTAALMATFLCYGVIQEKIMTTAYGTNEKGEEIFFTYSAWLVLNNRIVSIVGALILIAMNKESWRATAPIYNYAGISFSNVVSTYCQYEALKFVSFPTQTLGKCGKMIPVMILGVFLLGKKYNLQNYAMAVALTVGCTIFLLTGDISDGHAEAGDTPIGLFLMAGYLFTDGFTSTFQEKLFRGYSMTTYNQMLYVNICAAILSISFLTLQGVLFESWFFSLSYPQLLFDAFLLSLCSFFGQTVIYYTIKEFGAFIFSIIMTLRQFFAILLSCILYFHPLSAGQWVGTAIVFATLGYEAYLKKNQHHASRGKEPNKKEEPDLESQGGDIKSSGKV